MSVPWATHRRAIPLQHLLEHRQAGADGELEQLGLGVEEELDEREVERRLDGRGTSHSIVSFGADPG
jgi:hypothetical protein